MISRWESENGYPDIELLPAIADFFAVSIDELLGYRRSEREEELAQVKKEMLRVKEVGTPDERVNFARTALIRFPGDNEIKAFLAVSLYFQYLFGERKDEAATEEAEALCRSVMENSKDLDTKYDAVNTLIAHYKETGETEKAYQTAQPSLNCRKDSRPSATARLSISWARASNSRLRSNPLVSLLSNPVS